MNQIKVYADERTLAFCAFCGGKTGTRDHCPSRFFLDEPFPPNLPVVPSCSSCNGGFSADEEYLACLISCVLARSTNPKNIFRKKIARILERKHALRERINACRSVSKGTIIFSPEYERISNVITKLAQGHALYELHESCSCGPDHVFFFPLSLLSDDERNEFENPPGIEVWPEVGSRAMQRILTGQDLDTKGWLTVQPQRYRYVASAGNGIDVRMVIHEYLGCQVQWFS